VRSSTYTFLLFFLVFNENSYWIITAWIHQGIFFRKYYRRHLRVHPFFYVDIWVVPMNTTIAGNSSWWPLLLPYVIWRGHYTGSQSASGSGSVMMATRKTSLLLAVAVFMLHSAQAGDSNVSTLGTVLNIRILIFFNLLLNFYIIFIFFSWRIRSSWPLPIQN
jgi:hypothetical protein